MKKRIVSIALALVMVVAMIPAVLLNASAAHPFNDASYDVRYTQQSISVDAQAEDVYKESQKVSSVRNEYPTKTTSSVGSQFDSYTVVTDDGFYVYTTVYDNTIGSEYMEFNSGRGNNTEVSDSDRFRYYFTVTYSDSTKMWGYFEMDYYAKNVSEKFANVNANSTNFSKYNKTLNHATIRCTDAAGTSKLHWGENALLSKTSEIKYASRIIRDDSGFAYAWAGEFFIPWDVAGMRPAGDTALPSMSIGARSDNQDWSITASTNDAGETVYTPTQTVWGYAFDKNTDNTKNWWAAGTQYSYDFTPLKYVSDSTTMYSVYTTAQHVELDGKLDDLYLNSTKVVRGDHWGGSTHQIDWYSYSVAGLDGLYIFAHVDDTTMNNINDHDAATGERVQVYLDWTPHGFAHDDLSTNNTEDAYRQSFGNQIGFIAADYDGNYNAARDFEYSIRDSRVAVNKIGNPAWDGLDPNTQYIGYDLEIFVPYTDYMKTVVATHSGSYHFSMGFQIVDDETYDGAASETSQAYDASGGGNYWLCYENLPEVKLNYADDMPYGTGNYYDTKADALVVLDGKNTNGEYDNAPAISIDKGGSGTADSRNVFRVINDGKFIGVYMEIYDSTINAADKVDFFYGRNSDNQHYTKGNCIELLRGFGTHEGWIKSNEIEGGWAVEARFVISDREKVMYREGKLIYQIGVMYKDADTDTVKYSYADLASCYEGKGTTNGIVNGELIPKFVISPEVNISPVITGANVALGESITMNYYVRLGLENTNAKLKVTMNGKVTYLGAQVSTVDGLYKFAFEGIAPQCMGDKIKAELIVDGEVVGVKDSYSVLDNVTSKNVMNDSSKTLIADLLAYGAAAQQYVNYNASALVNKGYENLATTVSSVSGDYTFDKGTATDASFANAYVNHANATRIFVKITATDISKVSVTINGKKAVIEEIDGEYFVSVDVKAIDFGNPCFFVLTTTTGVQRLMYSVNAYCKTVISSGDAYEVALAKALYAYGASAKAYVG